MDKNNSLEPVRQVVAHELVLDRIRKAIEVGQFYPGDRLPSERDMAEQLEVSRTTVRMAISVLVHEGLISVRRGRGGGFVVQAPKYDSASMRAVLQENSADIRQTFEFRAIVESAAASLAALRRTAEELADLESLLDRMNLSLSRCLSNQSAENARHFQTIDSEFHVAIARAARNSQLMEAIIQVRSRMWLPVGSIFGRIEPNANDLHQEILEAIKSCDANLASQVMTQHINETRDTISQWLER